MGATDGISGKIVFLLLLISAFSIFFYTVYTRIQFLLLGKAKEEGRFDNINQRIKDVIIYVFGQKRVISEIDGFTHFFIFWGFIVLAIGVVGAIIEGFDHDFGRIMFNGQTLFSKIFILSQDLAASFVFIVLLIVVHRRYVIKPDRLDNTWDAALILGLIFTIVIADLFMGGLRIHHSFLENKIIPDWSLWSPVSYIIFSKIVSGLQIDKTVILHNIIWWIHMIVILGFLTYLPFSKHMHIFMAIFNIFFRTYKPAGELTKMHIDMESDEDQSFGVSHIQEYSWKHLMDTYACTECGRCQDNCPAYISGKSLSPKKFIHSLREEILSKGPELLKKQNNKDKKEDKTEEGSSLIEKVVKKDEIWACTTCGSCQQQCPVFIEHVQKIIDLRRYLVLMESDFPEESQLALTNMEKNSNPWGIGYNLRGDWASDLEIPKMSEEREYLFYVGCSGSFDDRNKKIAISLAKILKTAKIDFGILGKEEKCCGDSARRIGNEYLFQEMVTSNIDSFKEHGVKKIITLCPHGYNTFKNEYPQFEGGKFEVYHYTEILEKLIKEGKIKLTKPLNKSIVYHDSCYLGRINKIFEPPRNIIKSIPGSKLIEMDRKLEKSFCCGAGGGRMWMEEEAEHRVNQHRVKQAIEKKPDIIGAVCPFCITMFQDGLKELNNESIIVKDISELVLESIENK